MCLEEMQLPGLCVHAPIPAPIHQQHPPSMHVYGQQEPTEYEVVVVGGQQIRRYSARVHLHMK